jgi:hypothetical protein
MINKTLETFDTIKKDFKKYLSDYKNLYETLNVDMSDTSPYTPGEKYLKMQEFHASLLNLINHSTEMLNFVKEVCSD